MMILENCYTRSRILIFILIGLIILFVPTLLHAQFTEFQPEFYYQNSLAIQKTGIIILTSWAGLNILTGISGNFRYQNESKYFFQMNAAWNVVNLGIAAFGFVGIANAVLEVDASNMFQEMEKFDRILLINVGLDVFYISIGSYLLSAGLKNNRVRFIGYGRSIILQGGFLFLFDLILFLVHSPNTKSLYQITEKINITITGFTLVF